MAVEGNAYTNILKMMKHQGYNKDSQIVIGKVTSISPLKFSVNGLHIEEGDYFLAESLKEHERKVKLQTTTISSSLNSVTVGDHGSHTHTINSFNVTDGLLTVLSPLELDDFVLVLIDGNSFYIIDRVVSP